MVKDKMRILVGYDGSDDALVALADLVRAGLPRQGEALVVSVGDVWVSPSSSIKEIAGTALASRRVTAAIMQVQAQASKVLEEAREWAREASQLIKADFPQWNVRAEPLTGTPSLALIEEADKWDADLVVVGSHSRSTLGRFFLGSVSKKVATESHCSVRVARHPLENVHEGRERIIIGVDGSPSAGLAVREVGRRAWPEGTEARIIAVDDGISPTRIAAILPTTAAINNDCNEKAAVKARTMLDWATEQLRAIALTVTAEIKEGDPQRVLIDEAQRWEADSIFVGSRGFNSNLERFRAGNVSTGLVTGAPCSVEIVRERRE